MKQIIILLSLILIINSSDIQTCQCSNLKTQFDCENAVNYQIANQDMFNLKVCFWYQELCVDILKDLQIPCSDLNQNTCNNLPSCAWYNNKCQTFTKCLDYQYDKNILSSSCSEINCLDNGTTCTFDIIGREEQKCEDIATEDDCSRIYLLYKKTICNWTGSQCVGQILQSCSGLTQKQCIQVNSQCAWNNNACAKKTCADGQYPFYQNEGVKLCSSYIDIETNQITYCSLDEDGQCITYDPVELDRRNCYGQSFQQYTWDPANKECVQCT